MSIQKIIDNRYVYGIIALLVFLIVVPTIITNYESMYSVKCPESDLEETLVFYQNMDELNFTDEDPSTSILLPSTGSNANLDFDIGDVTNETGGLINSTEIIEDSTSDGQSGISSDVVYASITIEDSCYLSNISAYLRDGFDGDSTFNCYIIKSYWDSVNSRSMIVSEGNASCLYRAVQFNLGGYTDGWCVFLNYSTYLDVNDVDNNTWFIGIKDDTGDGSWNFDNNDGLDEMVAYIDTTYTANDYLLKLGLYTEVVVNPAYSYEINYESTEIDINFTLTDIEELQIVNISWYCDVNYTLEELECDCYTLLMSFTIDFELNDYAFHSEVNFNSDFTFVSMLFDGSPDSATNTSGWIYFDQDNGDYELLFEICCSKSEMWDLLPIFIIIAILFTGLYVVYQRKNK